MFPSSTPIIAEVESNDSIREENLPNTKSIPIDDEDEHVYFNALEQQPQIIQVIGPRHPTLISSETDSNKILPFLQRDPRANLTSLINHTPKNYSKAMISPNKENGILQ
ncbi:hypothetical protein O181_060026 [Austropuccinia psidii MF-1]|uniref:Uncharacterized protein n=1 Tax=Austropuccinia psidii MF-1 TaxID=1389203 RepID=A0A9Q3EK44_9BASI|nr:hypothetical protein [Austropuccinia psidii MF-1]